MARLLVTFFTVLMFGENFYDFKLKMADSTELDLKDLKGRVVLVVNTATRCGFAGQLKELEKLRSEWEPKGLTILAIPTNDFGNQEPLSGEELVKTCKGVHGANYLIAERTSVREPVLEYLVNESAKIGSFPKRIMWNFEKFLLDRKGNLRARFRSTTSPLSDAVVKKISELISEEQ